MNEAEIRTKLIDSYQNLSLEAEATKQSMLLPFGLLDIYDSFNNEEKTHSQKIISEWMISKESDFRWIAKFIIRQRNIVTLISSVKTIVEYLKKVNKTPQIKNEIEDLENLIDELSEAIKN